MQQIKVTEHLPLMNVVTTQVAATEVLESLGNIMNVNVHRLIPHLETHLSNSPMEMRISSPIKALAVVDSKEVQAVGQFGSLLQIALK